MTEPQTTEQNDGIKAASASAWKRSAFHTVRLHSGVFVKIRIPDLPAMIEAGNIPQNLVKVAISAAGGGMMEEPSVELIAQSREFTDLMVLKSVVEPKVTAEDLPDIPYEDKQLLVEIATRQRDVDAEGTHLAGLETSEKFRRFRKIREFDPSLADL